jgi:hypothetical protein
MQTNVYPDSPDYVFITIVDHHNEYQLPHHPKITQRTMWDGSDAEDVISHFIKLFCPDYKRAKYQTVNEDHLAAVLKQKCFTNPNKLPDPIEPLDLSCDANATIYRIGGCIPDLHEWANQFAIDIKRECHNVGGDDGYYDYFPTFHFMFYCVCRELNLHDLYDSTIDYVNTNPESQYHDDDEDTMENMWRN